MKSKLFFFISFVFIHFSKAQFLIGAKSGLTFGLIHTIPRNKGFEFNQTWPGFAFSLIGEYRFFKKFALQLGTSWTQKNIHINRNPYISYYFNNYIEVPLSLKYFFYKKKKFNSFLNVGGYIAHLSWAYEKGTKNTLIESEKYPYYIYSGKYVFDSKKDVRWDMGILGSLGIEYKKDRHHIFLENQSSYGFVSTRKKRPFKFMRRNMVNITYIGYIYEL